MKSGYFGIAAAVLCSILPLAAADGDFIAETAQAETFRLYVNERNAYSLESAEEVASWPIVWRKGETVSAAAMDGTLYALSDGTGDATSAILPEQKGGVWMFSDTSEGMVRTARVVVPWELYQGTGVPLVQSASFGSYAVDFMQDGPDRKVKDGHITPIAYSGDNWGGRSESAQSTLTITSPSGVLCCSENLVGTGIYPFELNSVGRWTLALELSDGSMLCATIGRTGGLVVSIQ